MHSLKKVSLYLFFTFGLFFCVPNAGQEKPLLAPPKLILTQQFLENLVQWHQSETLKTASVGVCVVPLDTNTTWVAYNEHQALATASTLKAITTASSLLILGENFRFTTVLEYGGSLENGVLKGNLFIKGEGDPNLGSKKLSGFSMKELFAQWIKQLKTQYNLKTIEGSVIADPSLFDSQLAARTWSWEDMGNYYGGGAAGLNINQNEYRLVFKPSATVGGEAKVLRTEPEIPDIIFINEMKTGTRNSGDNGYIFGTHYAKEKYLRGTVPTGRSEFSIRGSIPNPPLFCAQAFTNALRQQGITVEKPASVYTNKNSNSKRSPLITHQSKPLAEIIIPTNHKSINLNTEAILKRMGAEDNSVGNHKSGAKAVKKLWKERGVNMQGFFMEDGSGLSRFNAVTPKQMAEILRKMSQTEAYDAFKNSLPIFGQTGTLERIGKGSFAAGKIQAKSGLIKRVRGYVGYAKTLKGEEVAFAILVNNHDASYRELNTFFREIMEGIVRLEME